MFFAGDLHHPDQRPNQGRDFRRHLLQLAVQAVDFGEPRFVKINPLLQRSSGGFFDRAEIDEQAQGDIGEPPLRRTGGIPLHPEGLLALDDKLLRLFVVTSGDQFAEALQEAPFFE